MLRMLGTEQEAEGASGATPADPRAETVLRRKALAGRPVSDSPKAGAERAVKLAFARAGQAVPGLDLRVDSLTDNRRALAELLDLIPDQALLAVLEGPAEGLGLVAMTQPVLSGIVEVQTTGRLAPGEHQARKPTRTDAAMTADLIDTALSELEQELSETPEVTWAGGFRYASFLDDARPLGLLLEEIAYRVFVASVSLGNGARTGEMLVVFPAEGRGPGPIVAASAETQQDDGARAEWARELEEAVMGAEATLCGVLYRLRLPLSAVLALKAGDSIPIPAAQLDRIEVEGVDGRHVAVARLGQNRGMRALRLTRPPQSEGAGDRMADAPSAETGFAGGALPEPGGGSLGGAAGPLPGTLPAPDPLDDLLPAELPMAEPLGLDGLSDALPLPEPLAMEEDGDLPPMARAMGGL